MKQNTFLRDPLKSILQNYHLHNREPVIGILRRNLFEVFVYWELPESNDKENEYYLRLIDNSEEVQNIILLVKIDINNNRYYLNIPPEVKHCEAELIAKTPEGKELLLISTIKEKEVREKLISSKGIKTTSFNSADRESIIFCETHKISNRLELKKENLPSAKDREKYIIKNHSSWSRKRV